MDPLDAFMSGIQEEVRKINRVDMRGGVKKGTKVTGKRQAIYVCCVVVTHEVMCMCSFPYIMIPSPRTMCVCTKRPHKRNVVIYYHFFFALEYFYHQTYSMRYIMKYEWVFFFFFLYYIFVNVYLTFFLFFHVSSFNRTYWYVYCVLFLPVCLELQ